MYMCTYSAPAVAFIHHGLLCIYFGCTRECIRTGQIYKWAGARPLTDREVIKGMCDDIKRRAALKDFKASKAAARKAKRDAIRDQLLAELQGKARAAWADQPVASDCKDIYLRALKLKQVRAICDFTHLHLTGNEAKKTLNFRRGMDSDAKANAFVSLIHNDLQIVGAVAPVYDTAANSWKLPDLPNEQPDEQSDSDYSGEGSDDS